MKKIVLLFLVLALGLNSQIFAYDFSALINGDSIYFDITSTSPKTVSVTFHHWSYNSYSANITIPDSVNYNDNYYRVTSIGNHAFHDCSNLTFVSLPNSITSIGNYAFYNCNAINSIVLPYSLTSIGSYAFSNCTNLKSTIFPISMLTIGDYAFENCSAMTSLVIPDNVTSIGGFAFRGCANLNHLVLGRSINTVGVDCFAGCNSIDTLFYNAINCSNYISDQIVPSRVNARIVIMRDDVVSFPNKLLQSSLRLEYLKTGDSLTSISLQALAGCTNLERVIIGSSVTTIEGHAFSSCLKLDSIVFPESLLTIGNSAFASCTSLTSVVIPDSVVVIGERAFFGCSSLKHIVIGESVESMGSYVLFKSDSIDTIYYNARNCIYNPPSWYPEPANMKAFIIGDSVISFSNKLLRGSTRLEYLKIGNAITNIGDSAMHGCKNLENLIIGKSVVSIGDYAFNNCEKLNSIAFPNPLLTIGDFAFENCNAITSLVIPDYVTSIGIRAFSNCTSLSHLVIGKSVEGIGGNAFGDCYSIDTLYYNAINCSSYNFPYNDVGSIKAKIVIMGDSVISFSDKMLQYSTRLEYLKTGASLTSIEDFAIDGCENLQNVILGNSLASIGACAFRNCAKLNTVVFPSSLLTIKDYAFYNCSGLNSITCDAISPPTIHSNTFKDVDKSIPLYLPCHTIPSYQADIYWNKFTNMISDDISIFIDAEICYGESYTLDGFDESETGTYTQNLQSVNGCDSIITLNLVVLNPIPIDISRVSVNDNNKNVIYWENEEPIEEYNIYRKNDDSDEYLLIANIPFGGENFYIDNEADASSRAYSYKISTIDVCLNESELSSVHRTIFLSIVHELEDSWKLSWNAYEGVDYSIFKIYRSINSLDDMSLINTVPSDVTSYIDVINFGDNVYYRIEIELEGKIISSNTISIHTSSIEEISYNNLITTLYPNPSDGKASLSVSGLDSEASVIVYDAIGNLVQKHIISAGVSELELDLSNSPKGIYTLRIENNRINQTKKLIIQ